MLTRDKGWIKPLLVLALVSWIPVVGQVVILGYGLEWARLTAWGVDAAPKQHGIDHKKMLCSGAIAEVIAIVVSAVLGICGYFAFKRVFFGVMGSTGLADILADGVLSSVALAFFEGGMDILPFIVLFAVVLVIQALVLASQLRATLYDGFGAGWRFDRLVQMVIRDVSGFAHVCLIIAVWSLVSALLDKVVATCASAGYFMVGMMGMSLGMYGVQAMSLLSTGILPAMLIALVAVIGLFAFQVVKVALQLVAINAMGQWFQRFDVGRWGVSSAPLPDGVPRRETRGGTQAAPSQPDDPDVKGQRDQSAPAAGAAPEEAAAADDGAEPKTKREPILLGPITDVVDDGAQDPDHS